jgi:site-specific DNA recombinase
VEQLQTSPQTFFSELHSTRGLCSKTGQAFLPSTIRYMLDNPKYRGWSEYLFRHDGEVHCLIEGTHQAIVPEAA